MALEQEACAHLRPLNWELFQRFDQKQMHRLLRLMPFLRLGEERWVFGGEDSHGEWPRDTQRSFLILSGSIRLFLQQRQEEPSLQLEAGAIFGDQHIRVGDEPVHDAVGVAAVCSKPCTIGVLTRDVLRTTFADRTVSDLRMAKVLQKLPKLKEAVGQPDTQGNIPQVVADSFKEIARLGSNIQVEGGMNILSEESLDDCFLVVRDGVLEVRSDMILIERLETRPPRKIRVNVTIERGENLAGDSIWDRLDPYCIVKVGAFKQFRTPTINNAGTKPKWNHTGILKWDDGVDNNIDFEVYDYDKYSADDLVGIGQLKYHQFENGSYKGPVQLLQSKKGVFKSEKMTMVPGGTIYVKIDFDLEYPDTSNTRPNKMVFPDEVLMELHARTMFGHEQLLLGDRFREVLEKASDGLRYKLSLGDFRICCQFQKGLATTARVLKVSRRRFMQFLQHSCREEAMRNIAVVTSVEKQNALKDKVWKLIKKREREEQIKSLQGVGSEKKGPKQLDPSRFRVAFKGVKAKVIVRNALNLSGGGWFDKLDPYAVVSFRGGREKLTTSVLQDAGNDPFWDFDGMLTYHGETILDVQVWDYDKGSNDDLIATGMLPLEEICNGFEGMVILAKPDEGKKKKAKKQASIVLSIEWDRPAGMVDLEED
eukprot:gnl/MRDRNA2_/MRDRNA2_149822_c0_seq1.p1 gnl/MRDRNA2_/MRDRNA2_149822_c0~~gnl/MRDRNA2_/MRDRNA2_149822_c0_seq1.p1  ORF type:complete len:679 (+),score=142.57 gnl/MRDRNA2_/MRDRNA2_149822_c0_seq1:82-2037(+)